uniref:Uncharacterized protein n=1 Tax=Molossus molossus TaxID=27622 RepID=A0A7J8HBX8_MOLMO|nr:hypothetical protein HJG59_011135 [Molossus molossus]
MDRENTCWAEPVARLHSGGGQWCCCPACRPSAAGAAPWGPPACPCPSGGHSGCLGRCCLSIQEHISSLEAWEPHSNWCCCNETSASEMHETTGCGCIGGAHLARTLTRRLPTVFLSWHMGTNY